MTSAFQYRAVTAAGVMTSGVVEAGARQQVVEHIRGMGASPVEIRPVATPSTGRAVGGAVRFESGAARRAVTRAIGDLAVLIEAGLPLDRALSLARENIENRPTREAFDAILTRVREGSSLARAMAEVGAFPPLAQAMVAAGDANGRLGAALARLAATRAQAEELRALLTNAAVYPVTLALVAVGVILTLLLAVVPQFDTLLAGSAANLPPASALVVGASRGLRDWGWVLLGVLVLSALGLRRWLLQPRMREAIDRISLDLPVVGTLVVHIQTSRFARTLSVLVDSGVALPQALAIARQSLSNSHMAAAVGRVAAGLKEGGGLSAPLAATGVFPRLAIGFFRTGEETSQLGPMLGRLADGLDRDIRFRLQRTMALLTPVVTVVLGLLVAGIIAAMMTAILGFNDLAVGA